jgi:hypothetical protein
MKRSAHISAKTLMLSVLIAGVMVGARWFATRALAAEPLAAQINIKSVNGHATVCSDGSTFKPLHSGEVAGPGSILKTDAGATVDLVLQESGTVLRMLPDTTLEFAKLNKQRAGEQTVSDTSLKLLKGSVIGSQRKLAIPSHFDIAMAQGVATIVGTEYVVNASGAVTVLDGAVSVNYNLPGAIGSVKVDVPAGSTFDPATGTVVPTDPKYLQNIIADVNTVKQNAQVFKTGGATIVVMPEKFVSPTHGQGGQGGQGDNNNSQGGGNTGGNNQR